MKITTIKEELKKLNTHDAAVKIDALRRELFSLKINVATSHVKDYSQFKKLRKQIAILETYQRLHEVAR